MFFYYYSDLHSNALSGSLPDQWGFLLSLASLYATSFLTKLFSQLMLFPCLQSFTIQQPLGNASRPMGQYDFPLFVVSDFLLAMPQICFFDNFFHFRNLNNNIINGSLPPSWFSLTSLKRLQELSFLWDFLWSNIFTSFSHSLGRSTITTFLDLFLLN